MRGGTSVLKAITMRDFRSFREARLPLARLTVLVGANAAGKSNAIESLRFLSWLTRGQKLSALQFERSLRGKVDDLPRVGRRQFRLGCETDEAEWNRLDLTLDARPDGLHVVGERLSSPDAAVPLYDLDKPSSDRGSEVQVAYNNFARGGKKPHIACTDQLAIFTQLQSPASFAAKHKKAKEVIPRVTSRLEAALASTHFLDPVPERMRDYSFPTGDPLQSKGDNVSAVLYELWGDEAQAEAEPYATNRRDILGFIRSLPEQDIAGLSFLEEPRGGVMLQVTETFGGSHRTYDAPLLSDGTLRVLSIATALLSAPERSLVVIEEIDNGVHPSRARHLLVQLDEVARRRRLRVLLSTHNPALLDALPASALGDVVYCYRSPDDGSSRLLRLDDLPRYPELVAQGSLGHLVTSGVLERFVKHAPTGPTRRRSSSGWQSSRTTP